MFFLSEVRTIQIHKTMTSENYHWTGDRTPLFLSLLLLLLLLLLESQVGAEGFGCGSGS